MSGSAESGAESPEAGGASSGGEVVVFAAASLTGVFSRLGEAFTAQAPEAEVIFNFAGSQQLAQQLGQGAPADVFAAANERQMQVAVAAGRLQPDSVQPFAQNRLVVIAPAENPAGLETLQDLATPDIKLVLAAEEVPVGAYSRAFLQQAARSPDYGDAYRQAVLANVVSLETNVRVVLSKVALGEADAGIVYASDLYAPAAAEGETAPAARVQRIEIPDAYNVIAAYPIAPVADAADPALARQFVQFVLSDEGQAILEEYGFIPLAEPTPRDASAGQP